MEYYYLINDVQNGPVSYSQLVSLINEDTLVWREGIEWTAAKDIPELADNFKSKKQDTISANPIVQNADSVKQTMFSSAFSFDGRIRRTEYGFSLIIYFIVYFLFYDKTTFSVEWYFLIPMLWFIWAQGAKRCHDRGNSGWWQLIPLYGLWMIFAEGDTGENEYGRSPK